MRPAFPFGRRVIINSYITYTLTLQLSKCYAQYLVLNPCRTPLCTQTRDDNREQRHTRYPRRKLEYDLRFQRQKFERKWIIRMPFPAADCLVLRVFLVPRNMIPILY